ncbi:hypothetical protein I3842_15G063100 [Carya illinoinensis]|uniref:Transmembrane protein n=1 Tax=Carya illinoinensis TaxID=32201 RepID=A0A922ABX2_CARIL|nr:hypothetical protein I3842_15G063100 [Carya illinoinensis]
MQVVADGCSCFGDDRRVAGYGWLMIGGGGIISAVSVWCNQSTRLMVSGGWVGGWWWTTVTVVFFRRCRGESKLGIERNQNVQYIEILFPAVRDGDVFPAF